MNKHKIIIVSLVVLIIAITIGIVVINNNSDNTNDIIENNTQEEEYIPVYKDEVTEDTANLGYIIDKISNDSQDIQIDKITENTNILDTSNNEYNITRFQLATIIYNIIVEENKLSSSTPINITFDDNSDIPTKYFTAVAITSNLGILQYSDKFDGYKYVTKEEVDSAFSRLQDYLDNWVADENVVDISENTTVATNNTEDLQELEKEASDILKDREVEDKLNGQSVATIDKPETLQDIIKNIEAIQPFDIYDKDLYNKYGTTERIYYDYINIDEGMIDYSKLKSLTVDEDSEYLMKDANLVGITVTEPASFKAEDNGENKIIITNYDILTRLSWYNAGQTKCFGINDYSIVSSGDWYADAQNPIIVLDKAKIDSIGIVVRKDILENTNIGSVENVSNKYILVIIPLINIIDLA